MLDMSSPGSAGSKQTERAGSVKEQMDSRVRLAPVGQLISLAADTGLVRGLAAVR